MLDPRILETRRDEIITSCKRRRVDADLDAAIAAQQRVSEAQTELNGLNQRRNEHQVGGKGKLEPAERDAHVAEGRRLKEGVAGLEQRLADERETLGRDDVAILRVEQLYPLQPEDLEAALAPYADGVPVVWVQEEPENMGAWRRMRGKFGMNWFGRFPFRGIFRPASASPATGSAHSHRREQRELIVAAFEGLDS